MVVHECNWDEKSCRHIVSRYFSITISFKYDDDFFKVNKYVDGNMIFMSFPADPTVSTASPSEAVCASSY